MQTFLPYKDFTASAQALDDKRLGKQRVEAFQIQGVLAGLTKGWKHHPAVLMWEGYEDALALYGQAICLEWKRRGFEDNLYQNFIVGNQEVVYPSWLGNEDFHISHQSNLIRKNPEHYQLQFPTVSSDLPYVWPVTIKDIRAKEKLTLIS